MSPLQYRLCLLGQCDFGDPDTLRADTEELSGMVHIDQGGRLGTGGRFDSATEVRVLGLALLDQPEPRRFVKVSALWTRPSVIGCCVDPKEPGGANVGTNPWSNRPLTGRGNKVIKPSIGRVVWFWESYMAAQREGAQPHAAIVVYVHTDTLVNLTVFSDVGYPGAYTHIPLWQGEGERPQGMHCEWMPYQKGQAAKAEAGVGSEGLEKRIAVLEGLARSVWESKPQSAGLVTSPPPPPSTA